MNARKEDTRRKIVLGGLIVKAGLAEEASAVILGALVLAVDALNGPSAAARRAQFQAAGDEAFKDEPNNE